MQGGGGWRQHCCSYLCYTAVRCEWRENASRSISHHIYIGYNVFCVIILYVGRQLNESCTFSGQCEKGDRNMECRDHVCQCAYDFKATFYMGGNIVCTSKFLFNTVAYYIIYYLMIYSRDVFFSFV
jgi:hypothetical protein